MIITDLALDKYTLRVFRNAKLQALVWRTNIFGAPSFKQLVARRALESSCKQQVVQVIILEP